MPGDTIGNIHISEILHNGESALKAGCGSMTAPGWRQEQLLIMSMRSHIANTAWSTDAVGPGAAP